MSINLKRLFTDQLRRKLRTAAWKDREPLSCLNDRKVDQASQLECSSHVESDLSRTFSSCHRSNNPLQPKHMPFIIKNN